jgi:hypothetical protein
MGGFQSFELLTDFHGTWYECPQAPGTGPLSGPVEFGTTLEFYRVFYLKRILAIRVSVSFSDINIKD